MLEGGSPVRTGVALERRARGRRCEVGVVCLRAGIGAVLADALRETCPGRRAHRTRAGSGGSSPSDAVSPGEGLGRRKGSKLAHRRHRHVTGCPLLCPCPGWVGARDGRQPEDPRLRGSIGSVSGTVSVASRPFTVAPSHRAVRTIWVAVEPWSRGAPRTRDRGLLNRGAGERCHALHPPRAGSRLALVRVSLEPRRHRPAAKRGPVTVPSTTVPSGGCGVAGAAHRQGTATARRREATNSLQAFAPSGSSRPRRRRYRE